MISYCHVNRFFEPWCGGLSPALPWRGEGQALALRERRQLTLHRSAGACPPRCRGVARDRPSPYRAGDSSLFTVVRGPVLRVAVAWRGTGPRPTRQAAAHASPWCGGLSPALPWRGEGQALALQGQRRIPLHRSAGAWPPRALT